MSVPKGLNVFPSSDTVAVTPSDTVNLTKAARAIRVTIAGNVSYQSYAGGPLIANQRTAAFTAGETRHIYATRINATSTTATGIEAMI